MAARSKDKQFKYHTIDGSHAFQVAVFFPNFDFFKAAPYLCIWEECKADYPLCTIFKVYNHNVQKLNKILFRSEALPEEITGDEDNKNILEFAQIGTICAIPADEKSQDTVNFVKIVGHCIMIQRIK